MKDAIEKLLAISSTGLVERAPEPASERSPLERQLFDLLSRRNGFLAFESALHVFPSGSDKYIDLKRWNSWDLWRECYGELARDLTFFAEDIFGGQFCIRGDEILTFDPETADTEVIARSVAEWAGAILSDYKMLTGYTSAHAWQVQNGPLSVDHRLVPKIPFTLGGEYAIDNLFALRAEKGMRFRGELAVKLHDLPPGSQVEFKIVP